LILKPSEKNILKKMRKEVRQNGQLPDMHRMDQKYFRSIVKRYLQGDATAEEEKMIDSWYANMGKDFHSDLDGDEGSALENHYWSAISSQMGERRRGGSRMLTWYSIGIAATISIALFSYLYVAKYETPLKDMLAAVDMPSRRGLVVTSADVARVITLPDQSKVTLQPHSELKYSAAFDETERGVFLDGEAFFEVARDADRPFFVFTKNLTTKVLGTSFTVKAFQQEKNVIVEVKTGKVSVYTNDEAEEQSAVTGEIILTPNQKIVYDKAENRLSRMIVDKPQSILPAEDLKRMRFEAAPVSEIFEAMEKIYGVDIVFDETKFSLCTLTTSISDGDIYNRLDIICVAIGASYEVQENLILVRGAGCHNP
jgi:transmembrane sensor